MIFAVCSLVLAVVLFDLMCFTSYTWYSLLFNLMPPVRCVFLSEKSLWQWTEVAPEVFCFFFSEGQLCISFCQLLISPGLLLFVVDLEKELWPMAPYLCHLSDTRDLIRENPNRLRLFRMMPQNGIWNMHWRKDLLWLCPSHLSWHVFHAFKLKKPLPNDFRIEYGAWKKAITMRKYDDFYEWCDFPQFLLCLFWFSKRS